MAFNIDLARKDGATDAQIAEHLAKQSKFNIDLARKDGATDAQIAEHLAKGSTPKPAEEAIKAPTVEVPAKEKQAEPDTPWFRPLETAADAGLGLLKGAVNQARDTSKFLGASMPGGGVEDLIAKKLLGRDISKDLAKRGMPEFKKEDNASLADIVKSVDFKQFLNNQLGRSNDANATLEEDPLKFLAAYLQAKKSENTQALEAYDPTSPDDGFFTSLGKQAKFMASNPSTISTGLAESLPSMGEAGVIAKGLGAVTKLPIGTRMGLGEGAVAGMSASQSIKDQQEGKTLSPGQQLAVGVDAALTTMFSRLGKAVANKLKVGDIDELFAREAAGELTQAEAQALVRSKIGSALKAGAIESGVEEMPQSAVDQITQNIATGRPWDEGLPSSIVQGGMTAFPAGAGAGYLEQRKINSLANEPERQAELAKRQEKLNQEKADRDKKQLAVNRKIDTQNMTAEEKRRYDLEQKGEALPPSAAELEAENYVTGTNTGNTGAGTNLSGQSNTNQSNANTGNIDGSGMDGAGSNAGTTAQGANAQPATLEIPANATPELIEKINKYNTRLQEIAEGGARDKIKNKTNANIKLLSEINNDIAGLPTATATPPSSGFTDAEITEQENLNEEQKLETPVVEEATDDTAPELTEAEKLQIQKDKAVAKAKASAGKLAAGLTKLGRSNIVPEEEVDYLGEVTNLFSAAIEAGHITFQQATANVAEQLKEYGLSLDQIKEYLQAAYDRASAGLRAQAKQKQAADLEAQQKEAEAAAPERQAVLDQKEKERLDRVYLYNTDRLDNVSQEEIDGYEENHTIEGTPSWHTKGGLNNAERALFLEVNDTQGSAAAFEALRNFRKKSTAKTMERTSNSNAALYELNKAAASEEHGIEFPDWQELSEEAQDAYLSDLPKLSKSNPSHSGEALHNAFGKTAAQLEKEGVGIRGAHYTDIERAKLDQQSGQTQETVQAEMQQDRAKEAEAMGKGEPLTDEVKGMLIAGDINGVLGTLAAAAKGIKETYKGREIGRFRLLADYRKEITQTVNKAIAAGLDKLQYNSKVVTDVNDVVIQRLLETNKLAEYDPKTDTFYFTPEGFDEATVLHEIIHAGTVKIINMFYVSPNLLSQSQREAVEHLLKIYEFAKPRLNGKFPNAFENLYEFVAYALSDFKFQSALADVQARPLTKYTVFDKDLAFARWEEYSQTLPVEVQNNPQEMEKIKQRYNEMRSSTDLNKGLWNQITQAIARMHGILDERLQKFNWLADDMYKIVAKQFFSSKQDMEELYQDVSIDDLDPQQKETFDATVDKLINSVKTAEEADLLNAIFGELDRANQMTVGAAAELDKLNKLLAKRYLKEQKAAKVEKKAAEAQTTTSVRSEKKLLGAKRGYEGNALLEITEAFGKILASPEAGIDVDPLAARRIQIPTTPPAAARSKRVENEADNLILKKAGNAALTVLWGHIKNPRHAYRAAIKALQSNSNGLRLVEKNLKLSNTIERDERKTNLFNDVYSQLIKAMSRTYRITSKSITPLEKKITKAISDIKKEAKEFSPEELMANLQLWFTGLHEPERRRWFFMKNVPLSTDVNRLINVAGIMDTPAHHRDRLIASFKNLKDSPGGMTALEKAEKIRERLDELIFEIDPATGKAMVGDLMSEDATARMGKINKAHMDQNELKKHPNKFLENHNDQSVVGGYTSERISDFLGELNSKTYKPLVMELFNTMKELQDVTATLHLQSNFYTQANLNYIRGSGYKWYVPFKGRPELEEKTITNGFGDDVRYSSDLQFGESVAKGRESTATNPIAQTIVDAKKAAYILAHQPVTQATVNNIKQGTITGKKVKVIKNEDRYKEALEKDRRTIWLHKPDGSIEVWEIEDKDILDGLRKPYKEFSSVVTKNIANTWSAGTRLVGQGYTIFDLKFAPANAVKDIVPNYFFISVEYGLKPGFKFLGDILNNAVSDSITGGGVFSAGTAMYHYQNGNFAALEKKALNDEFTNDFLQLANADGIVVFAQGVSSEIESKRLESTIERDVKSNFNPAKAIPAVYDATLVPFEYWMHMSEVTVRVTVFKTTRDYLLSQGIPEAEAISEAATFTKEVANFEHSGASNFASDLSRLYAFTRSTATGTARFFQDLSYIMPYAKSSALEDLPDSIKNNPVALAHFKENFSTKQARAAVMTATYVGLGMMIYAMSLSGSEDDEFGRNKVANDDPSLWARSVRFYTRYMKEPLQIPTGYGPGALIAMGAQTQILIEGNQTYDEYLKNIQSILQDSFSPIQLSKMPFSDDPGAWLLDTVSPTLFKGGAESFMNVNGLGMQIVLKSQGNEADAYRSHGNIPEWAKAAAEGLNSYTLEHLGKKNLVDISPNTVYHLASFYANGITQLANLIEKARMIGKGERDYDAATTNPVVDAFVGVESNPDSRENIRINRDINHLEKALDSAEKDRRGNINTYEAENKYDRLVINNLRRYNARLDELRHERNVINQNESKLDFKGRQYLLDLNKRNQEMLKAEINRSLKVDNPELRTAKDRDLK